MASQHGVNALPPQEQDGKGRISIILWGLASKVIEEDGSPPLLGSDGKGPHANHNKRPFGHGHGHRGGGGDMGRREDRSRHSSSYNHHNHHHHHRGRHGGNHGRDDRRDSRRDRNASLSRSPPPAAAGRRSSMERHGPNHHNRGHHKGDGRYERN
jgi:hypothetical protein